MEETKITNRPYGLQAPGGERADGAYWVRIKGDWKPVVGQLREGKWYVDGKEVQVDFVGWRVEDL